jgi:uncharacterized protein (TIGR00255 family)
MLKSMTGFGRAEGETALGKVFVEVRSVNHRYSDITIKLPRRLAPFEGWIRERVRAEVSRGRIDVVIKLDTTGEGKVQLNADLHLAEQYYKALQSIREKLQLKEEITLNMLAAAKDLITGKEETEDVKPYWEEIEGILRKSLQAMDEMKRSEGEILAKDIQERLERVSEEIETIKRLYPTRLEANRDRLRERVEGLLLGNAIDPGRLEQEVAILAERTDITEEMVRGASHLAQLSSLIAGGNAVGRKLEFLLQEIHREVNTASAKANDAEISQRVVEIKSELEKIREQVQNVE